MSDQRWLAPLSVREEPLPDGQVPRAAPYRVSARPFPRNPAHPADDTGRDAEINGPLLDSPSPPVPSASQPSQTEPSIAAVRRNPSSSPRSVSRGRSRTSTTARGSSGTSTRRYPSISPRATPPSSIATGTCRGPRRSSRSSNPCASPAWTSANSRRRTSSPGAATSPRSSAPRGTPETRGTWRRSSCTESPCSTSWNRPPHSPASPSARAATRSWRTGGTRSRRRAPAGCTTSPSIASTLFAPSCAPGLGGTGSSWAARWTAGTAKERGWPGTSS